MIAFLIAVVLGLLVNQHSKRSASIGDIQVNIPELLSRDLVEVKSFRQIHLSRWDGCFSQEWMLSFEGEYGEPRDIVHYLGDVVSCEENDHSSVRIIALVIDKDAPMEKVKEILFELRKANHLKVLFKVNAKA